MKIRTAKKEKKKKSFSTNASKIMRYSYLFIISSLIPWKTQSFNSVFLHRRSRTAPRFTQLFGVREELGDNNSLDLDSMRISELRDLAQELGLGSTSDCFEKKDLVERVRAAIESPQAVTENSADVGSDETGSSQKGESTSSGDDSKPQTQETVGPPPPPPPSLSDMSVRELRTLIHVAGLSSRGLLEKPEFLARAREAQVAMAARITPDAQRFAELDVQFFGRKSCPYCVDATKLIEARMAGVAAVSPSSPAIGAMLDVERSPEAASEFQRAMAAIAAADPSQAPGGGGVPFFFSPKTGKGASGWRSGASDLSWLVEALE